MTKRSLTTLRIELGISRTQWPAVVEAAEDAALPVRDYCRLMVLVAAGHGGVIEHAERAVDGSWDVSR